MLPVQPSEIEIEIPSVSDIATSIPVIGSIFGGLFGGGKHHPGIYVYQFRDGIQIDSNGRVIAREYRGRKIGGPYAAPEKWGWKLPRTSWMVRRFAIALNDLPRQVRIMVAPQVNALFQRIRDFKVQTHLEALRQQASFITEFDKRLSKKLAEAFSKFLAELHGLDPEEIRKAYFEPRLAGTHVESSVRAKIRAGLTKTGDLVRYLQHKADFEEYKKLMEQVRSRFFSPPAVVQKAFQGFSFPAFFFLLAGSVYLLTKKKQESSL